MVTDLRADRPPLDAAATDPLTFTPGVSLARRHPSLALHRHGEQIGQWEVGDARGHALHVLEAVAVADLDAAYRRALVGMVDLDEATAVVVVDDLRHHCTDWTVTPEDQ